MRLIAGLRTFLLAALVGGVVALSAFVLMERWLPGEVTIAPGVEGTITVVIEGAVNQPGLHDLPSGARLNDAIAAAGGLQDHADTTSLNLAGRVGDGERITIPSRTASPTAAPGATPGDPSAMPDAGLININTAGVAELDQLPGVGPVIAQRIIDFREFYGPFTSIEQLAEVEGISDSMLERLRPLVTLGE